MLPALENKAIDGFATSLPFTTQAVSKGAAIMLASGTTDVPDLLPFAYDLVYQNRRLASRTATSALKIVRAYAKANQMIIESPRKRSKSSRNVSARWIPRCLPQHGKSSQRLTRKISAFP